MVRALRIRGSEALRGDKRRGFALMGVGAITLAAFGARAGETRCWLDKGAVVVPAAFGDIAGDFLLDLSRPVTALHDTRANMNGLTGPSATATLSVAGVSFRRRTLPIIDLDPQTAPFDTTINGILGADIARGRVLTLDFRGGGCRLSLGKGAPAGRGQGSSLPLTWIAGIPVAPAIISDGVKARSGLFALGTARAASVVSAARLSRPAKAGDPIRLRALEFGGQLFEQTPAETPSEISAGPAARIAGDIGTSVLARGRLILDARNGVLKIEAAP